MKLRGFCLALGAVVMFSCPLAAQTRDNGRFYVEVTGHALFPHAASIPTGDIGVQSPGFNTGAGLTAGFGAFVGQGFSTELEWGYQRAGIGDPDENLLLSAGGAGFIDFGGIDWTGAVPLPFSLRIDGEIRAQSLMGNLYYRHPSWRISPYAGFGAGIVFYDARIDTQLELLPSGESLEEGLPPLTTNVRSEERRFVHQLMTGLSLRLYPRVEMRIGYRYRSGRDGPFNSDQVEGGVRFRF